MDNNSINHFHIYKVQCMTEVAKDIIIELFKKRYFNKFGVEWDKSNKFIMNNSEFYKSCKDPQLKNMMNNGELSNLEILCKVLTEPNINNQLKTNEKEQQQITKENQVLLKIHKFIDFKLTKQWYESVEKGSKEYLKVLKPTFNGGLEIDYLINTLQVPKEEDAAGGIKLANEKFAHSAKEKGNALFKAGKFLEASESYNSGLLVGGGSAVGSSGGVSNYMKSILNLNNATTLTSLYDKTPKESLLVEALQCARNACVCRPQWVKAYQKVAAIYKLLGDISKTCATLEGALSVDCITPDERNTINLDINKMFGRTTSATTTTTKATATVASTGKRDILKEVQQFIKTNGSLEDRFPKKYIKSEKELLKGFGGNSDIIKQSNVTGFSYQHCLDVFFQGYATGLLLPLKKYKEALPFYYHARSFGSSLFQMGKIFQEGYPGIGKDYQLALSMFYRSAIQNPTFQIPNIDNLKDDPDNQLLYGKNFNVDSSACHLGLMFEKGLYGVDKDIEKSEYFYKIAADLKNGDACYNYASLLIGTGREELGYKYYEIGSKEGHTECLVFLLLNRPNDARVHIIKAQELHGFNSLSIFSGWLRLSLSKYRLVYNKVIQNYPTIQKYSRQDNPPVELKKIYMTFSALNHFMDSLKKDLTDRLMIVFSFLSLSFRTGFQFANLPPPVVEESNELLEQLLIIVPNDRDLVISYVGLNILDRTKQEKCLTLLDEILDATKDLNIKDEIREDVVELPFDFLFLKSILNLLMGNFKIGLDNLNKCISVYPNSNEHYYYFKAIALDCLNVLELDIEKRYQSEESYLKYLEIAPKDGFKVPECNLKLSVIYSEKNQISKSKQYYQNSITAEKELIFNYVPPFNFSLINHKPTMLHQLKVNKVIS